MIQPMALTPRSGFSDSRDCNLNSRQRYWRRIFRSYRIAVARKEGEKANFNPGQPRVPVGQPTGGRWTTEGGSVAIDYSNALTGISQSLLGNGNYDVEQSFNAEKPTDYGEPGSIRTDVVLRNYIGDIIAIYDVKTGGAALTASRVRQIRGKTGVGIETPIIELQVNRGASIKSYVVGRRLIGKIIARLWNPVHRDSVGPGRAA